MVDKSIEQRQAEAQAAQQRIDARAKSAADHEKERFREVMQHPAAQGRFDLALNLLSVTGPSEMTPAEIIKALEKAPLPQVAAPLPEPTFSPQGEQGVVQHLGLTPKQLEFERDYARGAACARYLLGKE